MNETLLNETPSKSPRYGHFDPEHREYVITDPRTPMPWMNYLFNDEYVAPISTTGASCGIVYLLGGDKMKAAIQNMLGNVTGMLCDGAKAGCAFKVATCTNAAVHSALMAIEGREIKSTDGIIENDPEKTI